MRVRLLSATQHPQRLVRFGCLAALLLLTVGQQATSPVLAHAGSAGVPPSTVVSQYVDSGGHVHVTYASGVKVIDGTQAQLPTPAVTGTASADFQAFVKNKYQPVVTPVYAMVRSTSGLMTEISAPIPTPNCVAPPANFNIATASMSDLTRYGFPTMDQGMTRAQYNQKYSWMKHRVCTLEITNAPPNRAAQWRAISQYAGNVADQDPCSGSYVAGLGCPQGSPYWYTEADADFYMPCFRGVSLNSPVASESDWVGVGGIQNTVGWNELAQTGTSIYAIDATVIYATFIEYEGNLGGSGPVDVNIGAGCGSHLYGKVQYNDYTLGNIDTGDFSTTYGWGPDPDEATAEFIVERDGGSQGLANYGSIDFKGMGVTTTSLGYLSMSNAEHDYFRLMDPGTASGLELAHVGPIVYDGSDYPYDDNTITWENACNGVCP